MNIKKIGHCCLRITHKNLTILTDPGTFSSEQDAEQGIDIILITHEHQDHIHIPSLQTVLKNNPQAKVITNTGVAKMLDQAGISYEILEDKKSCVHKDVTIEACDNAHAEIFEDFGQVQNTGFLIDDHFFYPGDAYTNPGKPIHILALPVAGPWCKIADAIRYALSLKPKFVFPVHDGMLQVDRIGGSHRVPEVILSKQGINFIPLKSGEEHIF